MAVNESILKIGGEIRERFELIKRNTLEIINEEALIKLIKDKKQPVVYCGYEPSGPMHLGHFVTITKLIDFANAGFKVKILLADIHALLNRKGGIDEIEKETEHWKKTIGAIDINAEIVLGSSFQFNMDYQKEVMKLAQVATINRGLRSMQEIARDIKHATISQLWYPLMQIADIKYIGADVAEGGLEQRKVHVLGKDLNKVLGHDFVAVHTPLITSLRGPGEKMSKSIGGSWISVTDSYEQICSVVRSAYCPEKIYQKNPILEISKLVIFPRTKSFMIHRSKKYGGDIEFFSYDELESFYKAGKVHPLDVKNAVVEYLEKIIAPIRKNWK